MTGDEKDDNLPPLAVWTDREIADSEAGSEGSNVVYNGWLGENSDLTSVMTGLKEPEPTAHSM